MYTMHSIAGFFANPPIVFYHYVQTCFSLWQVEIQPAYRLVMQATLHTYPGTIPLIELTRQQCV